MSELRVLPGGPEGTEPEPQAGLVPAGQRIRVVVHRMDGGLENGESEARALSAAGFPIFTQADPDRPRLIPLTDIKYVVLGSVEDPNLEDDPGDKAAGRKAILRFRDGEWIPAYMDPSQVNDGVGLAVKIRLTERQRVIQDPLHSAVAPTSSRRQPVRARTCTSWRTTSVTASRWCATRA